MCNARAWPRNVGRAVQTAPILLRYASVITEQTVGICWFKRLTRLTLSNNSKQHATTCKNKQQGVPTDATCYIQQCLELLAYNVASVCTGLYTLSS